MITAGENSTKIGFEGTIFADWDAVRGIWGGEGPLVPFAGAC